MKTLIQGKRGYSCIRIYRNMLYIGLPRRATGKDSVNLATGLEDTPRGRQSCEQLRTIIDTDIDRQDFDETLERYKPKHRRKEALERLNPIKLASLPDLYSEYVQYRKHSTSPSTHKSVYQHNLGILHQCPHKSATEHQKISNWLLANFTNESARRTLVQINACLKWAIETERVPTINNPYPAIIKSLAGKRKKRGEIVYYSACDRDLIIKYAYEFAGLIRDKSNQKFNYYAELLELLFLTGMRWSEAIALNCEDWNGKKLTIDKAVVEGVSGMELKDGLKAEEKRRIPVTPRTKQLLDSITKERTGLLFPPIRGKKWIAYGNYDKRFWKELLIYINGSTIPEVPIYTIYSTRHTFITLALQNGYSVQDVANLAGNSPEVIYKHYAGLTKHLSLKNF